MYYCIVYNKYNGEILNMLEADMPPEDALCVPGHLFDLIDPDLHRVSGSRIVDKEALADGI